MTEIILSVVNAMEWDTSKKNTAKKFNIYTLIPLTDYV
jgi:hypothetical protein